MYLGNYSIVDGDTHNYNIVIYYSVIRMCIIYSTSPRLWHLVVFSLSYYRVSLYTSLFLKKDLSIYDCNVIFKDSFIYGCAGSLLLCVGFL